MRAFEELDKKGNSTGSSIIILKKPEGLIIMEAMELYCKTYKRRKKAKALFDYMENTIPFA